MNGDEIMQSLNKIVDNFYKAVEKGNCKDYNSDTVKAMVKIFLESTYIIQTSKNIDTVVGRFKDLMEQTFKLLPYKWCYLYATDMQLALDRYKQLYYDRIPNEEQIMMITEPSSKNLQQIFLPNIMRCTTQYYETLIETVSKLKSKNAKINRLDKGFRLIYLAGSSLKFVTHFNKEKEFELLMSYEKNINDMMVELNTFYPL